MPHERFTRVAGYLVAELDKDNVPWPQDGLFGDAEDAYISINGRHRREAAAGQLEPTRYIVLEVRRN